MVDQTELIPLGLDTPAETREKVSHSDLAGTETGTRGEFDAELQKLIDTWPMLTATQQHEVLRFTESLRKNPNDFQRG